MDFEMAAEHTDFGKGDGSLSARLSCPGRSALEAADSLTVRAAFIVIALVSFGLWAVIWLVVFSLA